LNKLLLVLPLLAIFTIGITTAYSWDGNNINWNQNNDNQWGGHDNNWNDNNHDSESNGLAQRVQELENKIEALETQVYGINENKIAELEFKTNPKLLGSHMEIGISSLFPPDPDCTYLNIGTNETEETVVYGWCPESSELVYWIPNVNATHGSIVLTNIHRHSDYPSEATPNCKSTFSGTRELPLTNFTGFIIECDTQSSPYPDFRDMLAYTIFPSE